MNTADKAKDLIPKSAQWGGTQDSGVSRATPTKKCESGEGRCPLLCRRRKEDTLVGFIEKTTINFQNQLNLDFLGLYVVEASFDGGAKWGFDGAKSILDTS